MAATLPVAQSRIVARLATGDLVDATVAEINTLLGAGGAGDVSGPASSTDDALARFDLATGKLIQDSLILLDDAGSLTGINELTTSGVVNAGDPGFEASGVNIGGVIFDSIFKANDIGGSQPAQSVIHRHSTVLQAALLGTRSKTDDDTHAPLTNGDSAFSIFGAYRTVGQYDLCGEILFKAAAGTISATSSPGTIVFKTTPAGSTTPVDVLTLDEDKSATFTGDIAVTGTVDGRDVATDGTKLDALTLLTTKGDLTVFTTGETRLAVGTNGQILEADSTQASGVKWATVGTEGLTLLATATASASSSVDFTTGIDSTYEEYQIHIINLVPATDNEQLSFRISTDGGSTFKAGASDYSYSSLRQSALGVGFAQDSDTAATLIALSSLAGAVGLGNAASESYSGVITIFNPSETSLKKLILLNGVYVGSDGNARSFNGFGAYIGSTVAIDALRIIMTAGNITSGELKLYGVEK